MPPAVPARSVVNAVFRKIKEILRIRFRVGFVFVCCGNEKRFFLVMTEEILLGLNSNTILVWSFDVTNNKNNTIIVN